MLRNLLYIPYYLIKTSRKDFWENVAYLVEYQNRSKLNVIYDIVKCSIVYSTSFMDYFLLRFFRKSNEERKGYAGTGFMYEYQLKMNPKSKRDILIDKVQFFQHYASFVGRRWFQIADFENRRIEISELIDSADRLVLKDSKGQAGKEVEVIDVIPFNDLLAYMKEHGFDLLEEFVNQHPLIQELAPRGLNTIRIVTQLNKGSEVDIIGTIFRLSIYSNTDNLTIGNAAALIDKDSGKVTRKAVYGDFKKDDLDTHPVSGNRIVDFEIPFWKESLELVVSAAKQSKGNKSIGWDVAITDKGPILIEGNHNWGRTLWQLPVDKGLKPILERYL